MTLEEKLAKLPPRFDEFLDEAIQLVPKNKRFNLEEIKDSLSFAAPEMLPFWMDQTVKFFEGEEELDHREKWLDDCFALWQKMFSDV